MVLFSMTFPSISSSGMMRPGWRVSIELAAERNSRYCKRLTKSEIGAEIAALQQGWRPSGFRMTQTDGVIGVCVAGVAAPLRMVERGPF